MAKTKLIVNLTRGECVCVGEVADRPLLRMRGLIGRRGLPAGEGMLLCPAPGIHTAFMRFSIDALFLDRNLRVLDIVEQLRPWRMASKYRARAVLELPAGECARRRVSVGDRLELRDRRPVSVEAPEVAEVAYERTSQLDETPGASWRRGELARLLPLRILVLSSDSQFRTVMSLLLARRNCSVTATANSSRLTELILREGPDVVMIDTTEPAAAAAVTTVKELGRPPGMVIVSDEDDSRQCEAPTFAKWGPFDDLLAAIERADESHKPRRASDLGSLR
jgi:uncharacterized protein